MSECPPFVFKPDGQWLVDEANGLRLRMRGGPEYAVSISVGPTAGETANGYLESKYDYIFFSFGSQLYELSQSFSIQSVRIDKAFDRDFPGRREELLDAVLPLLADFYFSQYAPRVTVEPIPQKMRACLRAKDAYFAFQDR